MVMASCVLLLHDLVLTPLCNMSCVLYLHLIALACCVGAGHSLCRSLTEFLPCVNVHPTCPAGGYEIACYKIPASGPCDTLSSHVQRLPARADRDEQQKCGQPHELRRIALLPNVQFQLPASTPMSGVLRPPPSTTMLKLPGSTASMCSRMSWTPLSHTARL